MHLGMPREPVEPRRQLQRRPVRILLPPQTTRFHPVPCHLGHITGRGVRQFFRHAPDLEFGNPQRFGDIGKSGTTLVRVESPDHGRMVRPVSGKNNIHHLVPSVMGKIKVNIRQLLQIHPFRIEKAPEVQFKPHRTHRADPKAITDQRIRRAAPRDPFNPALPAKLEQIPDDQKIFLIAHLADDAQFLFHLTPYSAGRRRPVTLLHPLAGQTGQKLPRQRSIRRRKPRKLQSAGRQDKLAPFGHLLRIPHHPRRRLHLPPPRKIPQPLSPLHLPRQGQIPDTLHDLIKFLLPRRRIPHLRKRRDRPQDQSLQHILIRPTEQTAQMPVTRGILDIGQIPHPPHLYLRPHDRLDPRFLRRGTKLHRPVQIRIGHRHRLYPPLPRQTHNVPRPEQRIHKAEATFHIQRRKGHAAHVSALHGTDERAARPSLFLNTAN